ncbi:signal protein [Actinocorallia longicatena]|uniref:Lipoprotein n=1 Tax=Actinocorallia longicatena TaxID=111803 RepID=A0ABP6Q9P7_9ACTN
MFRTAAVALGISLLLTGCAEKSGEHEDAKPLAQPVANVTDLQGRWWNWVLSTKTATSPIGDDKGANCAVKQPEDVWFLAGTFGGSVQRSCDVPAGRNILAPLLNLFSEGEEDCRQFMKAAKGSAVLDGASLEVETVASAPFTATPEAGNPLEWEPGTYRVFGCGMYVRIPPLTAGEHTLELRGASGSFANGVDYALTVR